ncbi:hypothetical protein U1Q18_019466 [Sarracenia purpurea var. burkii]
MTSPRPLNRRHDARFPPAASDSQSHSELLRRQGGFIAVHRLLTPSPETLETRRLTKLLLNVNIQGSLGTLQVVKSPENTTGDLIKAAIEIYVKEMRRPLLNETDPRRFELHYSQFSLEMRTIFQSSEQRTIHGSRAGAFIHRSCSRGITVPVEKGFTREGSNFATLFLATVICASSSDFARRSSVRPAFGFCSEIQEEIKGFDVEAQAKKTSTGESKRFDTANLEFHWFGV